MSDSRPRIAVSKPVNLAQLAGELGTPLAASLAADGATIAEVVVADAAATVTQVQLQSALDAHVATPTDADRATDLRGKAADALGVNATFLALPSPTAAQVSAQVKALTRQNNALIRLVIGALDSTTGT